MGSAECSRLLEKIVRFRILLKIDVRQYLVNSNYEVGEEHRETVADVLVIKELASLDCSYPDNGAHADVLAIAKEAVAIKDMTVWNALVVELNNRKEWIEVLGPTGVREVIAEVRGVHADVQAHELPELEVSL